MKKYIGIVLLAAFLCMGTLSLADAPPVAAPVSQMAIPANPADSSVVKVLKDVDSKIPSKLPGLILLMLPLVAEMLVRFIPTSQPRSLLLLIAMSLNLGASIFTKSSGLLDTFAQNLKDDKKR